MKNIFAVTLSALSLSAFSATEFYAKKLNQECTVSKNKVTNTLTLLKGSAGFTKTSTIETFGIEGLAVKAAAAATGRTVMNDYAFTVTIDGVVSNLYFGDSVEAETLIQFMTKACF